MEKELRLCELGERKIIDKILRPRYGSNLETFGDDCVSLIVEHQGDTIVATTDPCPIPMSWLIGFEDYYYWGWLLSTINLSDLAAAGADPLGILTSLTLPFDFLIDDFIRLLDGIDACCSLIGTKVLGGNLKESQKVDLSGTAIGLCEGRPLSRQGAHVGDRIIIFGDLGEFWAGYFMMTRDLQVTTEDEMLLRRNLLTPMPKVTVGKALRRTGALSACTDNSDGLYPSVLSLCQTNKLAARIDFTNVRLQSAVERVARQMMVDPIRFALGWGDWQLVTAVSPERLADAYSTSRELGLEIHDIGEFINPTDKSTSIRPRVEVAYGGRVGPLMTLDSQRFAQDSWFKTGVESYADRMINGDLVTD